MVARSSHHRISIFRRSYNPALPKYERYRRRLLREPPFFCRDFLAERLLLFDRQMTVHGRVHGTESNRIDRDMAWGKFLASAIVRLLMAPFVAE